MAKRRSKYTPWWEQRCGLPTDPTEVRVEGQVTYPDPKYGPVRAYPRDESKYLWQPLTNALRAMGITYTDTSYFMCDETRAQISFSAPDRDAVVKELARRLNLQDFDFNGGKLWITIRVPYSAVEHF